MAFGACQFSQLTVLLMMCFSEAVWSEWGTEMSGSTGVWLFEIHVNKKKIPTPFSVQVTSVNSGLL